MTSKDGEAGRRGDGVWQVVPDTGCCGTERLTRDRCRLVLKQLQQTTSITGIDKTVTSWEKYLVSTSLIITTTTTTTIIIINVINIIIITNCV